jgi:transcriptional regulator with XRE-family HTH domain
VADQFNQSLGRRIRSLRLRHRWSQADLAAASGLSRAHISLLENARKKAGTATLIKIAGAFGLTPAQLLGGLRE